MNNLKALIYFIVIIAFIVILIKKKALPFFKKKAVPDTGGLPAGKGTGSLPAQRKELRYEVLAFGTYDQPDPKDFENRIELQLEYELTKLANKQTPCHVDYVSVGCMLVLFISYEV